MSAGERAVLRPKRGHRAVIIGGIALMLVAAASAARYAEGGARSHCAIGQGAPAIGCFAQAVSHEDTGRLWLDLRTDGPFTAYGTAWVAETFRTDRAGSLEVTADVDGGATAGATGAWRYVISVAPLDDESLGCRSSVSVAPPGTGTIVASVPGTCIAETYRVQVAVVGSADPRAAARVGAPVHVRADTLITRIALNVR